MAQDLLNERLGLAWNVLWPAIQTPDSNGNIQSAFAAELYGLGLVSKDIEPSKFYEKVLSLWWNQRLDFCNKKQITSHNDHEFDKYITNIPKICPPNNSTTTNITIDEKSNSNANSNDNVNANSSNDDESLSTEDYLGFYQPKNGTCGLVAAYHALYLFKLFSNQFGRVKLKPTKNIQIGKDKKDTITTIEFEKETGQEKIDSLSECKDNDNRKELITKVLLCRAISHSLLLAYEKSQKKIEIVIGKDDKDNSKDNNGINTKQRWKCPNPVCNEWNNAGNAFCEHCFTDPSMFGNDDKNKEKDKEKDKDTDMTDKDKEKEVPQKEIIESSDSVFVVYGGNLPAQSKENEALLYNFGLFGFKIKQFQFPKKPASDKITDENNNYTQEYINYQNKCKKIESEIYVFLLSIYESDLISRGCCVRLLLSLVLSHSPTRCKYELTRSDSEDIYQDFRDETLVIAPFGFCSQNLVNLCLFGHCRPLIEAPRTCSYGYGFLGHDIINPGSTGFVQRGYGYEHPYFPIWVVLSGTHYTTLFGLPKIGMYNNENNNNNNNESSGNGDGKHSKNCVLDTYRNMMIWMNTDTTRNTNNKKDKKDKKDGKDGKAEANDNSSNKNEKWICDACGFTNNAEYVFCGTCARSKEDNDAANGNNNGNNNNNSNTTGNQDVKMKTTDSNTGDNTTTGKNGKEEAADDKDVNMTTDKEKDKEKEKEKENNGNKENDVTMDKNEKKTEEKESKSDDNDENKIHWELPLACFNGLPPSGPLIAPIVLKIISEQTDEAEQQERDRVIDANECLTILAKRGPKAEEKKKTNGNSNNGEKDSQNKDTTTDASNKDNNNESRNGDKIEEEEEEYDPNAKVEKFIRCHALVQRIKSKKYNNLYYYEMAVSMEQHFEGIQKWKSVYLSDLDDKYTNNDDCLSFFDPTRLPNTVLKSQGKEKNGNKDSDNSNKNGKLEVETDRSVVEELDYEYPNGKWRCCSCYLGDDVANKYAGYNDLDMVNCKACGKSISEGLRTIFLKYEELPMYVKEGKVDKVYEEPIVMLLKKRFRNLVQGTVYNNCLPVI